MAHERIGTNLNDRIVNAGLKPLSSSVCDQHSYHDGDYMGDLSRQLEHYHGCTDGVSHCSGERCCANYRVAPWTRKIAGLIFFPF